VIIAKRNVNRQSPTALETADPRPAATGLSHGSMSPDRLMSV